jgi:hypothetical protein
MVRRKLITWPQLVVLDRLSDTVRDLLGRRFSVSGIESTEVGEFVRHGIDLSRLRRDFAALVAN